MICPIWPAPDNVKALSTVRSLPDGKSQAPYDSFNLGDHVGDDLINVTANRQQLMALSEGCDDIRWLNQVHGVDCVDAKSVSNGYPADASFTRESSLACSIMTADCLPVLFCDLEGRQVAATHAGWRGLAEGVLANTLKTFLNNGIAANQVIAWLGPAISQPAFEVGPEVREAFLHFPNTEKSNNHCWADDRCFIPSENGRFKANLYRLARLQLEYLGISGVYGESSAEGEKSWCTYSDEDETGGPLFYSYRRESQTGRQASLIWKS